MSDLTGNSSFRVQTRWFRKPLIVLTVEVKTTYRNPTDYADPKNGKDHTFYVDASIHDLIKLQDMKK